MSARTVAEHALSVYYDGNKELANTILDRAIAEANDENQRGAAVETEARPSDSTREA